MVPDIYWLPEPPERLLAIVARPRPGDSLPDEIEGWNRAGLRVIVSLLEPAEVAAMGLLDEAKLCTSAGIEFVSFPVPDFGLPPSIESLLALTESLAGHIRRDRAVGIHCRGSIGRSGVVTSCVLVCLGYDAENALALTSGARGVSVPETREQRDYVMSFRPTRRR